MTWIPAPAPAERLVLHFEIPPDFADRLDAICTAIEAAAPSDDHRTAADIVLMLGILTAETLQRSGSLPHLFSDPAAFDPPPTEPSHPQAIDDPDDTCPVCGGSGTFLSCCDDLCHAQGECIHGDGEEMCPACQGSGQS